MNLLEGKCLECGGENYRHKPYCVVKVGVQPSNDLKNQVEELRAEVEAIKEFIRANGLPRKSVPGYWEES